jgi:mannitol/fructose-specific phosphotransferase system IIA component (Ntr-type)
MSYVILSVLIERSEQLGKLALLETVGHQLHLLQREGEHYLHATEEVRGSERPPMITVPEYQKLRGIAEDDRVLIEGAVLPGTEAMHPIGFLLDHAAVVPELSALSMEGALRELVGSFDPASIPGDRELVVSDLLDRERQMTTGIGQGIAVPHLVSPLSGALKIAIGRSSAGLDFGSFDREPVRLVVMLLAQESERDLYLKVLSAIARLFQEPGVLARALAAAGAEELLAVLKKYETLIRLRQELESGDSGPSPNT